MTQNEDLLGLKENPIHPVKEVRTTVGMTQEEFAEMLPIGRAQLAKIETWGAELTDKLTRAIAEQFGALVQTSPLKEWLNHGPQAIPVGGGGRGLQGHDWRLVKFKTLAKSTPYSLQHYERWVGPPAVRVKLDRIPGEDGWEAFLATLEAIRDAVGPAGSLGIQASIRVKGAPKRSLENLAGKIILKLGAQEEQIDVYLPTSDQAAEPQATIVVSPKTNRRVKIEISVPAP